MSSHNKRRGVFPYVFFGMRNQKSLVTAAFEPLLKRHRNRGRPCYVPSWKALQNKIGIRKYIYMTNYIVSMLNTPEFKAAECV